MKRTLTALTAVIFASALAIPALAQDSMSDTPSSSVSTSSTRESTRSDYRSEEPAPSSVERTERTYHSERTSEATAPVQPEVHVERKVTTRTETEAVPPPPVNQTTTTTTTHRTTTGY
jgi:hypothetical protein